MIKLRGTPHQTPPTCKNTPVLPSHPPEEKAVRPTTCTISHRSNSSKPSSFFDINYIFTDPFSLKKSSRPTSFVPKKLNSTRTGRKQQNSTHNGHYDSQRLTEPIHKKSNFNKCSLSFNKYEKRSTIHSCSYNNSQLRSSTRRDQNNKIGVEASINDLLVSKSLVSTEEKSQERQERRKRRDGEVGCQRVELISPRATIQKQVRESREKYMRQRQKQRYSSIDMEWARNALVMRNKKVIRIYRPWSPVQFQQEEDENSNICF